MTIPRLVLFAAVMLARFVVRVLDVLSISNALVNLWVDSSIVLAWIKEPSGGLCISRPFTTKTSRSSFMVARATLVKTPFSFVADLESSNRSRHRSQSSQGLNLLNRNVLTPSHLGPYLTIFDFKAAIAYHCMVICSS